MTCYLYFFFFNDTATTEIYTLSLHDALPISAGEGGHETGHVGLGTQRQRRQLQPHGPAFGAFGQRGRDREIKVGRDLAEQLRSEEHTSELQSPCNLVCRLLLEKKKNTQQSKPPSLGTVPELRESTARTNSSNKPYPRRTVPHLTPTPIPAATDLQS